MKQKAKKQANKEREGKRPMPCALSNSSDPLSDFEGTTGSQVKISVDSGSGGALIAVLFYAGNNQPAPANPDDPFSFVIQGGRKALTMLLDDPAPGDTVRIKEICPDGTSNVLRVFSFDPVGPTQTLIIKGL